jgi:CheY-like chemotaxis protein
MVVDDDDVIRRMLANALARAGYDVCTANDGAPAVRLAEVVHPDLIVLDLGMPTGGVEVVRTLKARYGARIHLVVLTGHDDPEVAASCREAGADDIATKPISPSELRRRLASAAHTLESRAAS